MGPFEKIPNGPRLHVLQPQNRHQVCDDWATGIQGGARGRRQYTTKRSAMWISQLIVFL
jgi:hypothetical protein